ncbi:response regulator transcription factor [Salinimonas lutimaris]|uniref:response regulator transcription factor n=1 Tax=Salinimonas lutimaris TaxID=914153 RepID=UPI0010C0BCE0|nr:response regulator transcription factor [Salinimonas lutimaris]
MRILFIEDSESLRKSLGLGLRKTGYSVDIAADGAEGLSMALMGEYDILILDLMLPEVDGMTILKTLRKRNMAVRVLILSARSEPEERTSGILAGADDYLSKPFAFDELCARLINLMRRGEPQYYRDVICVEKFELDLQSKHLSYDQQPVVLTPNEYRIVECLFSNKNRIVTSEKLSEYITGSYDSISKNAIEAHLSTIRRKVRKMGAELPVTNKRGFGYTVNAVS